MLRIIIYVSLIPVILASFAGCGNSPSAVEKPELPRQTLFIEADVALSGHVEWDVKTDSLVTTIRAKNEGDQPAIIKMGSCSFSILAYTLPGNDNKLVWHNSLPENYICLDEMLVLTIDPGNSKKLAGLTNISGKRWENDLPKGEWQFVLLAKSEEEQPIRVTMNSLLIE